MTFKEKLVILRKARGLTQDEFASAVGVSRQAVYKWECGQSYPEVPKLLEMKLLFNISLDDLLDDSYDIPVPEKKRRKRIPKDAMRNIEKNVESEIKKAATPAAPKVKVEEKKPEVETAPVIEEAPVKKDTLSAVQEILASINTNPVSAPAPQPKANTEKDEPKIYIPSVKEVEEEEKVKIPSFSSVTSTSLSDDDTPTITKVVTENEEEPKKVGLFGRLFGRK